MFFCIGGRGREDQRGEGRRGGKEERGCGYLYNVYEANVHVLNMKLHGNMCTVHVYNVPLLKGRGDGWAKR